MIARAIAAAITTTIGNTFVIRAVAVSSFTTTSAKRAASTSTNMVSKITGMPAGPYPVGVTTIQFDDKNRKDPGNSNKLRGLQTEIWYPANIDEASSKKTKYSDYLGIPDGCSKDEQNRILDIANGPNAIGGYRDGISIEELDDPRRTTWLTDAVRDVSFVKEKKKFPLVLFSHGSGAYRASYSYWTEFLASHGYVVAACDHPGSARFTIVDNAVIVPGGARSKMNSMKLERPKDMITVLDGIERLSSDDDSSMFAGRIDCTNVAVTGMSFGGQTAAEVLEFQDPRIKAAVLQCPAIASSGLNVEWKNRDTPIMVMLGTEDTVIGRYDGNDAARQYVDNHNEDAYLMEIVRGGHVSFTSCEMYDPEYGNGIADKRSCPSQTRPGTTYRPLDIVQQHTMINSYGLAFLNTYLQQKDENREYDQSYLDEKKNHFSTDELIFRKGTTTGK